MASRREKRQAIVCFIVPPVSCSVRIASAVPKEISRGNQFGGFKGPIFGFVSEGLERLSKNLEVSLNSMSLDGWGRQGKNFSLPLTQGAESLRRDLMDRQSFLQILDGSVDCLIAHMECAEVDADRLA